MSETLASKLAQLQTIDTTLLKIRVRLKEIDTALGADNRIRAAQESVQAAEADQRQGQGALQRVEDERRGVLVKRNSANEQLYSGG